MLGALSGYLDPALREEKRLTTDKTFVMSKGDQFSLPVGVEKFGVGLGWTSAHENMWVLIVSFEHRSDYINLMLATSVLFARPVTLMPRASCSQISTTMAFLTP
jgi:hypothetical protein